MVGVVLLYTYKMCNVGGVCVVGEPLVKGDLTGGNMRQRSVHKSLTPTDATRQMRWVGFVYRLRIQSSPEA